jgi:hypothetical protein
MKRIRIYVAIAAAILGGALVAQTDTEYQGWMKQVGATNGKLKGDIAAKNADAATADAKTLEGTFKQVADFWGKRNDKDAANIAMQAQTAAAAIPAAVAAGNFDLAAMNAQTIGGTCAGCHMAHREKGADGTFKIK